MSNKELESKRTKCLCYSRVCGWLAPTANFNLGKAAERKDRVNFLIK
jgi:hypothetical protein